MDRKRARASLKVKTKAFGGAGVLDFGGPGSRGGEAFLADAERFVVPLQARLSSRFGYRRRPMGGARRYHRGVDIAGERRSPIIAAASGEVVKVSRSWAKGLNVQIRHRDGYSTAYFHLAEATVLKGQWVRQRELIGYEGSSGQSTGPHLHFEIHRNGRPVDPMLYLPQLGRR